MCRRVPALQLRGWFGAPGARCRGCWWRSLTPGVRAHPCNLPSPCSISLQVLKQERVLCPLLFVSSLFLAQCRGSFSPLRSLCVLQAPAGFCCAEQRPGQAGEAGGQRPVPGTSLLQPELLGHLGSTRRELLQDCVAVARHKQPVELAEHRRPSAFQERALALTE